MALLYRHERGVTMRWHRDLSCVETQFAAGADTELLQNALEDALNLLITMDGSACIADLSACTGLDPDAVGHWLRTTWHPRALDAGLTRMAVVVPHNDNALGATLQGGLDQPAIALTFANRLQAERWLRSPVN